MSQMGAFSEVGKVRKVLVHRPGLGARAADAAEPRGVPLRRRRVGRARAARARRVHRRPARPWRRGRSTCSDLLAETLARLRGRTRTTSSTRAVSSYTVGLSLVDELRAWLLALPPERLAEVLVGGLLVSELDGVDLDALNRHSLGAVLAEPDTFVLPPLPNSVFTRDSSAWLYRRRRAAAAVLARAAARGRATSSADLPLPPDVRRRRTSSSGIRPRATSSASRVEDFGQGAIARGRRHHADREQDGARRHGRALDRPHGRARRALALRRRRGRARSSPAAWCRTARTCTSTRCSASSTATLSRCIPPVVEAMQRLQRAPGRRRGHVRGDRGEAACSRPWPTRSASRSCASIATGGDAFQSAREQWDDANNVVAHRARRGRRLLQEHAHERQAAGRRHRGHRDRGLRARQGPGRLPLHDLPDRSRRARVGALHDRWESRIGHTSPADSGYLAEQQDPATSGGHDDARTASHRSARARVRADLGDRGM